jgi:glutamyl-tRNA synthetase
MANSDARVAAAFTSTTEPLAFSFMSEVRVRFAPSPTGYLHVGSARTALYNWMYARHTGGKFILRIEDTDPERSKPELIDLIFRTLTWLGIDWDEEPIFQSQRAHLYNAAVEQLLSDGIAYHCSCTQEEVQARTAKNKTPGYDSYCRDRNVEPGPGTVVRFKTPREGSTAFPDLIRGEMVFENSSLEDFVIRRSDGTATFFVPNAVDDVEQRITHIVRGQDLINVTPKVLLIRHALGNFESPMFAHMPLIVNEQRKKLSKRRDDVAIEDFKDRGVLAAAMCNYIALLGWGPRDGIEVAPIDHFITQFDIADINPSPAFFDVMKLEYINGEYIRQLSVTEFINECEPFLADAPWPKENFHASVFGRMAAFVQERIRTLSEVVPMVEFLFVDELEYDEAAWKKNVAHNADASKAILAAAAEAYETTEWLVPALHDVTEQIAEKSGLKLGKAQAPIRLAITGRSIGPPLFESIEALGRDKTIERIEKAITRL